LAYLKDRLPGTEDLRLVFVGTVFLIHVWAIINMFDALPAWILRMRAFDLIGVVSYVLVFALLESLVATGALILLAVILPGKLLREKFLAQGTSLLLVAGLWSIVVHFYYGDMVANRQYLFLWGAGFLVTTWFVYWLAGRIGKIDTILRTVLQRLEFLSFVYLLIDSLAIIVIIIRNI